MKIAPCASIALLGLFVAATRLNADPPAAESTVNPYTEYDPDGVPLAVTHPRATAPTQDQITAFRKQQAQAELDKNWLLRSYEKQLQARAAADPSASQNTNLYYQLSLNKDLARLAGLPALDSGSDDSSTIYRTGATPSDQGTAALRPDTSTQSPVSAPLQHDLFKPLITPLSAPEAAGLHNFYSNEMPFSMTSPFSNGPAPRRVAPRPVESTDSSDLETPGMIAAEKDPLLDKNSTDLTLDVLPGESIEDARAHQDDYSKLQLPMDADQLHKAQAAALSPPRPDGLQNPNSIPVAPIAKPQQINDDEAPLPVSKALPINPVRAPIANPYDILNR